MLTQMSINRFMVSGLALTMVGFWLSFAMARAISSRHHDRPLSIMTKAAMGLFMVVFCLMWGGILLSGATTLIIIVRLLSGGRLP